MRRMLPYCLILTACAGGSDQAGAPPAGGDVLHWSWDASLLFPADRSLARPEDGVALSDGRLLVADQVAGLRMINPDGSNAPFGKMAAAGYRHEPPGHPGATNSVSLEPDGSHVLVSDVFGAAIYRVDVATGDAEKLYQHPYGINTAVRDGTGAIWFTQSTRNAPDSTSEARLFGAIDIPMPDGALYRLPMAGGKLAGTPELKVDSLLFGNGLAIDEAAGQLYLAETVAGRVTRYKVDLASGALSERTVFVDSIGPDNLELDGNGKLWIANPLENEVMMVDLTTGSRHSVFRQLTPAQDSVLQEFNRLGAAGQHRMQLFSPAMFDPLPGGITGIIVGKTGPVYFTTLGNALLKMTR